MKTKTLLSKLIVLTFFSLMVFAASESNAQQNTNYGDLSFANNVSGFNSSAFGYGSLNNNLFGSYNSAFGTYSLVFNTLGNYNSAFGEASLAFNDAGNFNCGFGLQSLYNNTEGNYNCAFGFNGLFSNTTGVANCAFGLQSLNNNSLGDYNCAFGFNSLYSNYAGLYNCAMGLMSLANNFNGNHNCAIGDSALFNSASGNGNVGVGRLALSSNVTGDHNTAVGNNADANAGGYTNSSCFGRDSRITASNQVRLGNADVTSIGGAVNWTKVSDARFKTNVQENVPGLAFINKLRAVTYTLDVASLKKHINGNAARDEVQTPMQTKTAIIESGFLAQEVEKTAQEVGYAFSGVDAPKNSTDIYGLRYADFVMPIVKSIQELSKMNDAKSQQIQDLQEEVNQLRTAVYGSSDMNNGTAKISINASANTSLLGQNIPNPAASNTIIPFRIPKNCNSASIVITEAGSGKIVTAIAVSCDQTNIALDAGNLASGSYTYSLYVDGNVVDTKHMILSK